MELTDMHCHMLFGVDDGPKTEDDMYRMVEAAYADGVRAICLTPHYHPGYFGENAGAADRALALLHHYAEQHCPHLRLFLGNELRYSQDCLSWLEEGRCRTMNQTRHVLVDFAQQESEGAILAAVEQLLNAGYIPILAHAERYRNLAVRRRRLSRLRENGVLIQVDAQSLFGYFGLRAQWRCKAILAGKLADLVASDAHDPGRRPPLLSKSYRYIAQRQGTAYAEAVCCKNAWRLLQGTTINEEVNRHG